MLLPTASLQILLALADAEKHGYAIMREVETLTEGAVRLGPGTLYGALKRLLADGLIEESDERPDPSIDDQRRRYYRLTPRGRAAASSELERLARILDTARRKRLLLPGEGEA
jgi:DNA-binding PadR family transcriptional regulator